MRTRKQCLRRKSQAARLIAETASTQASNAVSCKEMARSASSQACRGPWAQTSPRIARTWLKAPSPNKAPQAVESRSDLESCLRVNRAAPIPGHADVSEEAKNPAAERHAADRQHRPPQGAVALALVAYSCFTASIHESLSLLEAHCVRHQTLNDASGYAAFSRQRR